MILANVRASLTRDDAQLALRLVARESGCELERAEARLRDEGLDAVLDDPRLLGALCEAPRAARASLPLFCYVVVRHAMLRVGEQDRVLTDFVSGIVLHFGLGHRATRIAAVDDQQYDSLAALLGDVDGPDGRRTLLVRAHLGSYALWWCGLFPDHIEHRCWRRGGPDLEYYEELGRRGFQLAAEHRLAHEQGLTALFAGAAEHFPRLRVALSSISDALLFPHVTTPERLMRQVRDEARWRLT